MNLIDPDAITKRINGTQPSLAAIPVAREAILNCRFLLLDRQSFALETTLAGHSAMRVAREAKQAECHVLLLYLATGSPELHIERVRLWASRGGHNISDADIIRRYDRSLIHAPEAPRFVDDAVVLDNSGLRPLQMFVVRSGRVIWRADELPEWVQASVQSL